ncbi:xanthine dehydrogenase small subunit [Phyllobacterium phragmitis]|uniref:Xanthine dehydrogenase small subunit n=1 Tax=Phyllobacterium phragmitis TaxID=2670329 RepID=A0A2S9IYY8_9HYPH|nr:xanthine dehydrogenase small subunit [Phyllobacterium phragmitis]PRD45746.1 xanthine dehydrogenase small subunit [Phyllobacterium phragmitis]
MANSIRFFLNGQKQDVAVRPDITVLEWLRSGPRLTGTKEGCAEGDCGACSVLLGDASNGEIRYHAANSCIMTMGQIDGRALVTVEGLKGETLHPIQAAMAENGSSQCGFCTPGIVISLAGLAANETAADDHAIHDALAGNLCRCTGYRPIVEAARKVVGDGGASIPGPTVEAFEELKSSVEIATSGAVFHQPQTLDDLLKLRRDRPDTVLLAGGTDLGVALADFHGDWREVISTAHVRELRRIEETPAHLSFGAAVTWEEVLAHVAPLYPSFATLIRRFGSAQIRSMGTIGGNIGTASPIGDGPPALIALGAEIELASQGGKRTMPLEDFFLDYRKTELKPDEVIASIRISKPAGGQEFRVYKISKRYDQDISTVCGAFSVVRDGGIVKSARIAFGGMAAIPKRVREAEAALVGKRLDAEAARACAAAIRDAFAPLSDWRGSAEYRLMVAANLAERFRRDLLGETVEVMAL